jgi:chaperonin cofactor prefoldin|tara:strand:+ start:231 stop:428 length:198 start_codon:yes stop_codon:yes gene_type:complete
MTLHLSKEEFNKEIERLHNRINFLTKHVAKQNEEIENLKIKNRLLHAKNEVLEELETENYLETKN